jgi:hypothetical protein
MGKITQTVDPDRYFGQVLCGSNRVEPDPIRNARTVLGDTVEVAEVCSYRRASDTDQPQVRKDDQILSAVEAPVIPTGRQARTLCLPVGLPGR